MIKEYNNNNNIDYLRALKLKITMKSVYKIREFKKKHKIRSKYHIILTQKICITGSYQSYKVISPMQSGMLFHIIEAAIVKLFSFL